jgi:hypothetical protein
MKQTNSEAFRNTYPRIQNHVRKKKNQKKNIQTHMHKERDTSGVDSIPFLQSAVHESKIYEPPNQRNSIPTENSRENTWKEEETGESFERGVLVFKKTES